MKSSVKTWSNASTVLRPVDVARVFAAENLVGELFDVAMLSCSLFESGHIASAKNLVDAIPRSEFGSSLDYFRWAQFTALFLKSSLKGDQKTRESAAKKKFFAAEMACKRANRRLRYYGARPDRENPLYRVILARAKSLISRTLGNFSENTLEQILVWSRPGSGTAIGTRDPRLVSLPFKLGMETELVVTERAKPYARMLVEGSPAWFRLHADIDWSTRTYSLPYTSTATNRIAFVPKDARTMRTIAIEPALNMCLQLGTCEYLLRRLKSVGVDLRDQGANQRAAQEGARCWADLDPLVTLDLSSASDTLSIGLVERLLPSAWAGFLDDLRSPGFTLDGRAYTYHKWSSMGNGFTFPLESLIFWALAKSCTSMVESRDSIHVYGDDIVVPRGAAALLIEVLRYCGFSVNTEKSAVFGEFRESCGEDWFGTDRVVPCYLRYMELLRPTDVHRVVNTLDHRLARGATVSTLLKSLRGRPLLYGLPTSDPTSCIWSTNMDFLIRSGHLRYSKKWQSWTQLVAHFTPLKRRVRDEPGYAAALLGSRELTDRCIPRSTLRRRGKWNLLRISVG